MAHEEVYSQVFIALVSWKESDLEDIPDELFGFQDVCEHYFNFAVVRNVTIERCPRRRSTSFSERHLADEMQRFYDDIEKMRKGRALCIILYSGHGSEEIVKGREIANERSRAGEKYRCLQISRYVPVSVW